MTKLCRSVCAFAVVWSAGGTCFGQPAKETPKQMVERAKTMADQCGGLKLVCRAASMDKKYQQTCDDFKVSLNPVSNRDLATGFEKLEAKAYTTATHYANEVCDYDPELASKKRELLDAIRKAQEPPDESAAKANEVEHAFTSGDFDVARAAARQVTDKTQLARIEPVLQRMTSYETVIADARGKEGGDPAGALQGYKVALTIAPHGPGDPNGHIAALEQRLRAQQQSNAVPATQVADAHPQPPLPLNNRSGVGGKTPTTSALTPVQPPPEAPGVVAGRLVAEARQQRAQHNLQQAMRLYEEALRAQKGNVEALAELEQVKGLINTDPAEQAKVLAGAIRAFYAFNYAEAEDNLTTYLSSTTAKYRGAAYFYLGATRIYRDFLGDSGHKLKEVLNSQEVQRPFKEARNVCYRPIDKYLSPVVLSAWNASSGGSTCAR